MNLLACSNRGFFLLSYMTFLLLTLALVTGPATTIEATEDIPEAHHAETPPLISMIIKNMPIQKAASLIEKKTDYRIELQSINPDEWVSGQFVETDIETVCSNLLRKHNLLILIDTKERLITLKSLGTKNGSGKSDLPVDDGVHADVSEQNLRKADEGNALPFGNNVERSQRDPFTGMTYADIIALHNKQTAELEKDEQNGEHVDPFTGMTYAEIRKLHEEQIKSLAETQP